MLSVNGLASAWHLSRTVSQCTRQLSSGGFFGFFRQAEGRATRVPQTDTLDVCFVDPKLVLDHSENKDNAQLPYVQLKVPFSFLGELSKGVNELGDTDDPMNNWYFGKAGEIFQYQLIGTHPTSSGFTSVIAQHVLDEILAGDIREVPRWSEFRQLFDDGKLAWPSRRTPFLFAGRVVDSDEVAVYAMRKDDELQGVMVSSKAFED